VTFPFSLQMKPTIIRIVVGLSVSFELTACGAGTASDAPVQVAALVQVDNVTAQHISNTATATMPAPDCAAQNCRGLRIIDGNAEAYRYDAMRRIAADSPQT
jgi:hypothetical protein